MIGVFNQWADESFVRISAKDQYLIVRLEWGAPIFPILHFLEFVDDTAEVLSTAVRSIGLDHIYS